MRRVRLLNERHNAAWRFDARQLAVQSVGQNGYAVFRGAALNITGYLTADSATFADNKCFRVAVKLNIGLDQVHPIEQRKIFFATLTPAQANFFECLKMGVVTRGDVSQRRKSRATGA